MPTGEPPSTVRPWPWLLAGACVVAVHLIWLLPSVRTSDPASWAVAAAGASALVLLGIGLNRRHPVPGPTVLHWWAFGVVGLLVASALWGLREGPSSAMAAAAATAIASSPGAVLLSRPLALLTLRKHARTNGIALPHGRQLWRAANVDVLLLDKHRSVTTGAMEITSVEPIEEDHRNNLIFFAGALSHASDGPAAAALARRSGRGRITGFHEVPGDGVAGSVDRHPVRVGRPEWLGLPRPAGSGVTVGVEVDLRPLGAITLDDVVRADAAQRCAHLGAHTPVTLITDRPEPDAAALAAAVGLSEYVAACDADGRLDLVKRTQGDGRRACFVGPRTPLNQLALEQGDLVVTDDVDGTPPLPHAIRLSDFSIGSVDRALTVAREARRRVHQVGAVAAVLSLAGAATAATGVTGAAGASGVGLLVAALVTGWAYVATRSS